MATRIVSIEQAICEIKREAAIELLWEAVEASVYHFSLSKLFSMDNEFLLTHESGEANQAHDARHEFISTTNAQSYWQDPYNDPFWAYTPTLAMLMLADLGEL